MPTYKPMDPDLRRKLLAVLCGMGEKVYRQGRFKLRSIADEFCCLGVGCDLLGVEWVEDQSTDANGRYLAIGKGVVRGGSYPPEELWPLFGGYEAITELADQNDHLAKSFPEIADWIERNIPL